MSKEKLFLRLRGEVIAKGLTLKIVAAELGITPQSLSEKLRGKTEFTLGEMIKVCNLLDAPIDIFFEPKLHNLQFTKQASG